MHFWNDSWEIPQHSFVATLFMAFVLKKYVSLMMFLTWERGKSHMEQDQANKGVIQVL